MTDNIASTLKACHSLVWEARKELEYVWPTPNTEDALLFAFTELGEAIDAHLRTKGEYARNRDKELSVHDELADCALMLLTAYGDKWVDNDEERDGAWEEWQYTWHFYISDLNRIIDTRAEYGEEHDVFLFDWRWYAMSMVERIATHPGMDLPTVLRQRLDRIKWKRMKPTTKDEWERHWYGNYKYVHGGDLSFEEWKEWVNPDTNDIYADALLRQAGQAA